MKTRKALQSDLERMLEIEESAIPGYGYLFENKDFYFDGIQNQGEMILALKDDIPVGMGQYSLLPDGSGWLEILRVHKDFQHQGAGRAIYKRYMELAEKTDAPYIAMFTGRKNIASKSLAEKNNFKLVAAHFEYSLDLSDKSEISDDSFHLIQDAKEAEQLIQKESNSWGSFMGLNRTYFHMGTPLYQWLTKKKMVYSDGESTVVLGCRMLKHRGWYIGFMSGNLERCLNFAITRTLKENLPKLTISFSSDRSDLINPLEKAGFHSLGELIVMELNRKGEQHV